MDGITTDEIADLLRDDVPVIVISGQHTTTIAITGSYVLLHKPFDFGRLADELKKVLPVFETERSELAVAGSFTAPQAA